MVSQDRKSPRTGGHPTSFDCSSSKRLTLTKNPKTSLPVIRFACDRAYQLINLSINSLSTGAVCL